MNSYDRSPPHSSLAAAACMAGLAQAQTNKTRVTLAMVLEPPGLDPTIAPAAAIGEIVHYNVLEGLTKINVDGSVTPLLAESWTMEPDGKSYTFKLKKGVKFHDGEAFDVADVKFSFERAKDDKSTNKAKKAVFDNIARIDAPDAHTVILTLEQRRRQLPVPPGREHRRHPRPEERGRHGHQAGRHRALHASTTGRRASSVTLAKWDGFRDAKA